ncbi:MAG: septal ring lytic transglycosylase RlpA family protein [Pseudomonadota bacterium]
MLCGNPSILRLPSFALRFTGLQGLILSLALLGGCASQGVDPVGYRAEGKASWYGARHQGKRTASGERFDLNALTAAHRTLPFGTQVQVTHLQNGKTVVVRINDRGPHTRDRLIDLSQQAADRLGMRQAGVAAVRVEQLAD